MKKGEMSLLKKKIGLIDLKFGNQIFFGRRKISIYPHTSFALFYLLYSDLLDRRKINMTFSINSCLNLILKNERAKASNNKGNIYSLYSQMSSKINLFSSGNIQLNLPVFTKKVVNNSYSMVYQKTYNYLPDNLLKNYKNVIVSLPIHDGRFGLFSDEPLMNLQLTKDNEKSLPFKGRVRVGMGLFSEETSMSKIPVGVDNKFSNLFLNKVMTHRLAAHIFSNPSLPYTKYVHESNDSHIRKSVGKRGYDNFINNYDLIDPSNNKLRNTKSTSTELNDLHYFKNGYQDIEHRTTNPDNKDIDVMLNKKIQNNIVRNSDKPEINISYLADEVYRLLERKIRVEKERRGIFG